MPVSLTGSRLIYDTLKESNVRLLVPKVTTVRSVESFKAAVADAGQGKELTTIIAKVEATGPAAYVTGLSLLENRFQFSRHIQSLRKR